MRTTSTAGRILAGATVVVLAALGAPAAAHEPGVQLEQAHVWPTSAEARTIYGSVAFLAKDEQKAVAEDQAGDATASPAPLPGADLRQSVVRPLTPGRIEFTLRTNRADVVAPDGTTTTPGGAGLLYTWDITSAEPAPWDRLQVQARRCCAGSDASHPAEVVLLSHHDGSRYTRTTWLRGTFTHDSLSWLLDTQNEFARLTEYGERPVPAALRVSNAVFVVPGGGAIPVDRQLQGEQAVLVDRVSEFEYQHPLHRAWVSVSDRSATGYKYFEVELPVTPGIHFQDVEQGRHTYSVDVPTTARDVIDYVVVVHAEFEARDRAVPNSASRVVCGSWWTGPCPDPRMYGY